MRPSCREPVAAFEATPAAARRRGVLHMASTAFVLALAGGCASTAPAAEAPAVAMVEALPGLYTAGQPASGDWDAIAARGITTVVNLRTAGELAGRDEAAEVRAAGLRYVEIPVAGADGITVDNARLLHQALAPGHGQVLVHCASGNRAGALLGLEQADFDGMPAEAALELARKAGMTSTEPRLQQVLGLGR